MTFLPVPAAIYHVGSTRAQVETCVEKWHTRLLKAGYTKEMFAGWIEKEYPSHPVRSEGFELGRTLVSHADVKPYLDEIKAEIPESITVDNTDELPVWGVSLAWARAYAAWLSARDPGYAYRLPTETEWEIAARGLDQRLYAYGDKFNRDAANTCESGLGRPSPVERYAAYPGPFGHLDLSGNLEEWVDTPYYVYPGGRLIRDDLYDRLGMGYPVLRGGSFVCGGDLSRGARRHGPFPDPQYRYTGFRLVREVK